MHGIFQGGELTKAGPETFEDLYRSEYPGLVKLAYVLTGDGEAAEDAVQDAFAALHPNLANVRNPGGYLRVSVVNLCRNLGRRRRQDRQMGDRLQRPELSSLGASELVDVLLRLPYRQRAVLVLRYWGDWSEKEIASALKCRPGTVKTLASRGLLRLRREVEQ